MDVPATCERAQAAFLSAEGIMEDLDRRGQSHLKGCDRCMEFVETFRSLSPEAAFMAIILNAVANRGAPDDG